MQQGQYLYGIFIYKNKSVNLERTENRLKGDKFKMNDSKRLVEEWEK